MPTVVIEDFILGKAIISTDCPTGLREILLDGKMGIIIKIVDGVEYKNSYNFIKKMHVF